MVLSRCFLWAFKRGVATFTVGVNALSGIQGVKKLTLDVPGDPLSKVETYLVQKKVIRVPNIGGGPPRVNP